MQSLETKWQEPQSTPVGLFDFSHMGEIDFAGGSACNCLARPTSPDVDFVAVGQMCSPLILGEVGGVVDDVIVC